jgi:hypothetical protein
VTSAIDRKRLTKLLGMFGSDFDGEIVNAARLAEDLRRKSGRTWLELLNVRVRDDRGKLAAAMAEAQRLLAENDRLRDEVMRLRTEIERPTVPQPWREGQSLDDAIAGLLLWREHLNTWEEDFLESLGRRRKSLTERQLEVLKKTGKKVDCAIRVSWRYRQGRAA